MTHQADRGRFIEIMRAEGVPEYVSRGVLRHAATIQRLSAAECNGDWPCDNGERKVKSCVRCGTGYAPSTLARGGLCPSCRAGDRVTSLLGPYPVKVILGGDPRGACVKLAVPSGRTDDWGQEGICVPTREY